MANANATSKAQTVPASYTHDWISALDQRTRLARAVQGRLRALEADLGGDLSYQRQALAKRVVWTEALIEQFEAALARGDDVDIGKLVHLNNSLTGLLKTLGLDRVARDTPSLHEYIARRNAEANA